MKLLDQFAAACRTMNYAKATEECYTAWVVDYLHFHRRRAGHWVHPDHLREPEAEAFLTHLATDRRLAAEEPLARLAVIHRLEPVGVGRHVTPLLR